MPPPGARPVPFQKPPSRLRNLNTVNSRIARLIFQIAYPNAGSRQPKLKVEGACSGPLQCTMVKCVSFVVHEVETQALISFGV